MNNEISNKEIIEGNQEMALFCDAIEHTLDGGIYYNFENASFLDDAAPQSIHVEKLMFHKDWNWLMAVVEKIESTHDEFHGYFAVYPASNGCSIQGTRLRTDPKNKHYAYYSEEIAENKKRATWLCALRFIRWYKIQIFGEPITEEWISLKERIPQTAGFYQVKTHDRISDVPYVRTAHGELIWAKHFSEMVITHWRRQEHNKKQDEQGHG